MATLAAMFAEAAAPSDEIISALSRYYLSFRDKRSAFTPDDRMCQGAKDAKVTLVEFSDFECPYCKLARPVLENFVRERREVVRLCYAPFPLQSHPHAVKSGQAVLFARDRGKFWEMHDLLFDNQSELGPERILKLAAQLGLPPDELGRAWESGRYTAELEAVKSAGKAAGVDATPAVYLNGRKLWIPLSAEALGLAVEDELEWAASGSSWAED